MRTRWLFILLLGLCADVWAGPNDVMIDKVWVGESVPGQDSATLEMNISTVKAATLLSVSSPAAKRVEIHSVSRRGGKMAAKVVDHLRLPAHRTTAFGSDRLFLVMAGLQHELNVGERIPVNVEVEYANRRRQTIALEASVKKMALSYKHVQPGAVYDHR